MVTFINPKTDFAFKKIFGSPQSNGILMSFLNAILYPDQSGITDLEILDPYQAPRIEGIKDSYLDVKATLADQKTVIIEMQVLNVLGFEKRVLYNAAKAFSIQLGVGDDYALLNPVIGLTITDFEMFEHSPKVISRYRLKEKDDLTDCSDDIELVFVELPKFQQELSDLQALTDKWLYFLKAANQLQSVPPELDKIAAIHDAFEVARQSRLTREELDALERREMFLHDNRNAIRKAQILGEQKGLAAGLVQGRTEGRVEGEREATLAIVRSLLGVLELDTISRTTGLTIPELEQLRDSPRV